MNGFQDRTIKNFKDGILLDYLGAGYNISLVPVNMLERVEVYKGILLTGLRADALGGPVNMSCRHLLKMNVSTFLSFLLIYLPAKTG